MSLPTHSNGSLPLKNKSDSSEKQIKNHKLLNALEGKKQQEIPVWLMRQAGRYLPEYQKVRSQFTDFIAMCKSPEATTEVALQPLNRFKLDAAILFSDILTIPHALNLDLEFIEGTGPVIHNPIVKPVEIYRLPYDEVIEKCQYVFNAAKHLKDTLKDNYPIIGFAGSSWTQACYCIEGLGNGKFSKARAFAFEHPVAMGELIKQLSLLTATYLAKQAEAGCDVLFLIDTWGYLLPHQHYQKYVLESLKMVTETLRETYKIQTPVLFYSKGLRESHDDFMRNNPQITQGLAVDWTSDMNRLHTRLSQFCLQGNLDPHALLADPIEVQKNTQVMLDAIPDCFQGYIASLGHGILPNTPPESIEIFIDTVKAHKPS